VIRAQVVLRDAYLSAGFGDRDTLVDVGLGFPGFANDLLRGEAHSDHLSPFPSFYTNIMVGLLAGAIAVHDSIAEIA